MTKMKWLLITPVILFSSCAPKHVEPQMTQLEMRAIQSQELDVTDKKIAMKAVMNVLQDDGYIVKNAVMDLGLLSAEKSVDVENRGEAMMACFVMGQNARWSKHTVIEASANVDDFGDTTRIRVNFQMKTFDNVGAVQKVTTIQDPNYYQEFFAKLSKALFIQTEKL